MRGGELHVISTGRQEPKQLAKIVGVIHPYINAIHIREKQKTAKEIYDIVNLLIENNVPLSKIIVNDRVDVAIATRISGVQLAYHSLPAAAVKKQFARLRVGSSVHSITEAKNAQDQGADYCLFGHIFPTASKPGLAAKGLDQLQIISYTVSIPVIAIGGIKPANVGAVIKTGAKGIAVMSGVLESEDPLEVVKQYHRNLSIL